MEFTVNILERVAVSESGRWQVVVGRTAPARKVLIVGAFLSSLQILDGVLTSIGVSRFGVGMEGNPFLRQMMLEFGHIPTLAVLKLFAISIVLGLVLLSRRLTWIPSALGAVSCVYLFAAVIPWTYILFIQPMTHWS